LNKNCTCTYYGRKKNGPIAGRRYYSLISQCLVQSNWCATTTESTQLCGSQGYSGYYTRRHLIGKGYKSEGLFDLTIGTNEIMYFGFTYQEPMLIYNPLFFDRPCSILFNSRTNLCQACNTCNGGKGLQFDCSNIFRLDNVTRLPAVSNCTTISQL
jgi:hypothetical protein